MNTTRGNCSRRATQHRIGGQIRAD